MIYPDNFEEKINFPYIREWLREGCISPLGIRKVDELSFLASFDEIDLKTGQTEEFRQICLMEDGFPAQDFFDVTPMLGYIAVPGTFPNTEDVFALKKSLESIREVLTFFRNRDEQYPLLCRLTCNVDFFPELIKDVDRILDHNGRIRDHASPALADIRREIAEKQTSVARAMQRIIKQAQADGLVEAGVTPAIREGRAVIPVNASFKRKISGIVHDESATGRTSYIEPTEVVAAGNAIRELSFAEQREIVRILTAFADRLRPNIDGLFLSFDFLADMDFIRAKALLALRQNAVKPVFRPQQSFDWKRVVHPVMYVNFKKEHREVTPLDIFLTPEHRILLISGPNAGGKSVCLKTVGLVQYMFQCGLLAPMSENSEMGFFDAICIDIGDEQSIDNDLSTYSSHLMNMKQFIRRANPRTMILIDEFGAGTDPVIGGAIAEAILANLNAKGVWGVVTTHYGNLKHYASSAEGMVNGAMLFDNRRMQPFFRMETGKTGSSFAFEIARKTGIPEDVLAEAADKAGRQHIDLEKHLHEIERDRRYWERKREDVRKHEKRLGELSAKQLSELEKTSQERKTIIDNARREAQELLSTVNKTIENTIRDIRESQAEKETTKTARRKLEQFKEQAQQFAGEEEERILRKIAKLKEREQRRAEREAEQPVSVSLPAREKPEGENIRKGDRVRIEGQDAVGEVMEIGRKNVTVAFGQLLSTLPANRLIKVSNAEYKKQAVRSTPAIQVYNAGERRLHFKSFIDVRGMRTEEAIPEVEDLVDEASMFNIGEVRILHGKGNGILRQMIREYLTNSPAVASFDDEDLQQGGSGVTVVRIK
ncbi:MAG: Smr/MutS family protein [Bacteroidales bacterium]|jgi:DNA mismatch repair protein MutS2|nr:Smr/MutS family protein [Bacteroidales bacterium]